jgi:hypothetical protein
MGKRKHKNAICFAKETRSRAKRVEAKGVLITKNNFYRIVRQTVAIRTNKACAPL